jgi:pimeloyl-ACP methyl ester carboxylesterase
MTAFAERIVEVDGASLRALDGGSGLAVVVLDGAEGPRGSQFHEALAAHCRVVSLVCRDGDDGRGLVRALAALGIDRFTPIGHGARAELALRLALAAPEMVRSVVLLAPPVAGAGVAHLSSIAVPVLALFGTRDQESPPEEAHRWRASLKDCHLVMIYDAAHDLAEERPEAVAEVVADFVAHEDRFLVTRASGVIYP